MPSFAWLTAYVTPATPTGLVIAPDRTASALVATWAASTATYHEAYVVDAQTEDGDWVEVGRPVAPTFSYLGAGLNVATTIRVRDWTGSPSPSSYSSPMEASATLAAELDQLVHPGGDAAYTLDLHWVNVGSSRQRSLDQVILQPLSGSDGETAQPIVYTGQWQADRLTLTLSVLDDDRDLLRLLDRAARLDVAYLLLKSIKGSVHKVRLGDRREVETEAGWRVDLQATVVV